MSLREIILTLIKIALFFAFPAIWAWLMKVLPWWPFDPQSTLNILVFLIVTVVSWVLGYFNIKTFVTQLRKTGLAADVTL
jgi:sterol desaturase/sphingolipid hydroxylase (fatty acid hydroxylase superfamily)